VALRIEDYALVGDTHTAALVGRDGSIDWLCLPRFDSGAVFAALLGSPDEGCWRLAPERGGHTLARRYRSDTLVLETEMAGEDGVVRVVDCMPLRAQGPEERPQVLRLVEGVRGRVPMRSEVLLRPDYGRMLPWLRAEGRRLRVYSGPDAVVLDGDVVHEAEEAGARATFTVAEGDRVGLRMVWTGWGRGLPELPDVPRMVADTERWWRRWAQRCTYDGDHRDAVLRSLLTLKALSYAPTGGIVAAATTSLPERLGGARNWDYRYCWLRDATMTLLALLDGGYTEEAESWREWLLRALAGHPGQMQTMYGVDGRRRLSETELDWLDGYAGSRPVRVGNAAHQQFQLDVYGELMDALHQTRAHGIPPDEEAWRLQVRLLDHLEQQWREPDDGIWETRGARQHFVHSKVMAWVAFDRAIRGVRELGLEGPVDRWREVAQQIHDEVCEKGFDERRGTFTQYYGSEELDAATLQIAPLGFLPADDERVRGTVAAIEKELCRHGLVQRCTTLPHSDLSPEGAFLMCSFWLADNYSLQGRHEEARALFERLLSLANDVGLLSEQYDPDAGRMVGNFPQAFSHVALVTTALSLKTERGPAQRRGFRRSGGRW
jgi:GH15 family glucan-1,4-alpha-glucosidase